MRTVYQAEDGRIFNSKEECLIHEKNCIDIDYSAKITITFYLESTLYEADKREIEKGNITELLKEDLLDDIHSWGEALSKNSIKIEEINFKPSL